MILPRRKGSGLCFLLLRPWQDLVETSPRRCACVWLDVLWLLSGLPSLAPRRGSHFHPPHRLHPPTCHLRGVRKYRDCGALSSSGQLWSHSISKARLGLCSDRSCCPGCRQAGPAAQSQKSDRWRHHVGQTGWREAHPVSSFWRGTGLGSQAIFFLPRPAVSQVMKSVIRGELMFWTVRNPAVTGSLHGTGVRDSGCAAGESPP